VYVWCGRERYTDAYLCDVLEVFESEENTRRRWSLRHIYKILGTQFCQVELKRKRDARLHQEQPLADMTEGDDVNVSFDFGTEHDADSGDWHLITDEVQECIDHVCALIGHLFMYQTYCRCICSYLSVSFSLRDLIYRWGVCVCVCVCVCGRYRAMLVLHGNPQCGKSRLYEFVRSMFGVENCMELGNGDRVDFYWANLLSNLRAPHGNALMRTFLGNGE
jgi:hypothetical protein